MKSPRISVTEQMKFSIALKIEHRVNAMRVDWLKRSLMTATSMSHNQRDKELEMLGLNILVDVKKILGVK